MVFWYWRAPYLRGMCRRTKVLVNLILAVAADRVCADQRLDLIMKLVLVNLALQPRHPIGVLNLGQTIELVLEVLETRLGAGWDIDEVLLGILKGAPSAQSIARGSHEGTSAFRTS